MLRRYLRSMGSCIGYHSRGSRGSESSEDNPSLSHNRPLKHRKPKWKSNIRLTEAQLRAKREEFWDTAPAFEGRREIWDALKASVNALETGDFQMAQVILDGASISLPNGTLMDCYDELGNRYQLPVYILSAPINMIREGDEKEEEEEEGVRRKVQGVRKKELDGKQINIRIRFSTGEDRKLTVNTSENVAAVKRSLARCTPGIDPNTVRFFFAGKQLYNKMSLASAKIESNYTIQALIIDPSPSSTPALQVIPLKSSKDKLTCHQIPSKPQKQSSSSSIPNQHLQKIQKICIKQSLKPDCEDGVDEGCNKSCVGDYSVNGYNNGVNKDNDIDNCKEGSCNLHKIQNNVCSHSNENSFNSDPNEQQHLQPFLKQQIMNQQQQQGLKKRLYDEVPKDVNILFTTNDEDRFKINNSKYMIDTHNFENKLSPITLAIEDDNQQPNIPPQKHFCFSEEKLHKDPPHLEIDPPSILEEQRCERDCCQQQLMLEQKQLYRLNNCQSNSLKNYNCQQQQHDPSLEINT